MAEDMFVLLVTKSVGFASNLMRGLKRYGYDAAPCDTIADVPEIMAECMLFHTSIIDTRHFDVWDIWHLQQVVEGWQAEVPPPLLIAYDEGYWWMGDHVARLEAGDVRPMVVARALDELLTGECRTDDDYARRAGLTRA